MISGAPESLLLVNGSSELNDSVLILGENESPISLVRSLATKKITGKNSVKIVFLRKHYYSYNEIQYCINSVKHKQKPRI